ncbi:hypothetical protein MtrunA17_Chr5g0427121 [Medicago truncatula]|uniref:Transmembrane protein, putative n=1 Tax=Medicago truncatula TaxID=3880 RepID=G7KBG5_MEDTR|nr:transmembrane protein, putative [Medicago truncatula]RHN56221.1 hypothetical protein MtrunA17_Chr5g0427121 [Medicago truncatula]
MAQELENKLEEEQVRSIGELQKLSIFLTLVTAIFLTGMITITSSSATSAVDARDSLYSMMFSFGIFLHLTFVSFSLRFSLFRFCKTIISCLIAYGLLSGSFLLFHSLHTLLSIIIVGGGTNSYLSLLTFTMILVLCFVIIAAYVFCLVFSIFPLKNGGYSLPTNQ